MFMVKDTLRNSASPGFAAACIGLPAPRTTDSLSPFQVPRRSGIAVSAIAGAARRSAKATRLGSFDMAFLRSAHPVAAIDIVGLRHDIVRVRRGEEHRD